MEPVPAEAAVRALFEHVRDALEDNGDLVPAQDAPAGLLKAGNGACFQRDRPERDGDLRAVVAACVRHTRG